MKISVLAQMALQVRCYIDMESCKKCPVLATVPAATGSFLQEPMK